MDPLVSTLIYLLVVGAIFYLVWWGMSQLTLPEPVRVIILIILIIIAVLFLLRLLPLAGLRSP